MRIRNLSFIPKAPSAAHCHGKWITPDRDVLGNDSYVALSDPKKAVPLDPNDLCQLPGCFKVLRRRYDPKGPASKGSCCNAHQTAFMKGCKVYQGLSDQPLNDKTRECKIAQLERIYGTTYPLAREC